MLKRTIYLCRALNTCEIVTCNKKCGQYSNNLEGIVVSKVVQITFKTFFFD